MPALNELSTESPRVWRIFLSSTNTDLISHRQAVTDAIQRLGSLPVRMETFGAMPGMPLAECEEKVRQSDALVAVIAHRYGWVPNAEQGGRDRKSVTWLEVETALSLNRPVFPFIVEDSYPWTGPREQDELVQPHVNSDPSRVTDVALAVQDLQRFKNWLRNDAGLVVETFTTPQDLATKVISSLVIWAMRTLVPSLNLSALQSRARQQIYYSLGAHQYRFDWDVREQSVERLFIDEPNFGELSAPGTERPLVSPRSAVLLTGKSGQGKSWRLYRLGYELVEKGQLAILISATGNITSDLEAVATYFCRKIWEVPSVIPLPEIAALLSRELPSLPDPWVTVLIDGIKDEEYALSLLHYPWQKIGLRVALAGRLSERSLTDTNVLAVLNFSIPELSKYLSIRLGVEWMDFPQDLKEYLKLPLFAKLFCDLRTRGTVWKGVNEYYLFERVWVSKTVDAPLAASAVAGLASRIPDERIYPWPLAKIWAAGLRDGDIQALNDSGLLSLVNAGRSLEIWHDRILNWAVAEGLVGALRSGEITIETLVSRAIQGDSDDPLHRRLNYTAMDTLWLLATPDLGLDEAVSRFLDVLETRWQRDQLLRNLPTLGARITPYLISRLAGGTDPEEEV